MNWEQGLYQHLTADANLNAIGGRFLWDLAPPQTALPYVIIQQVASDETTTWDGSSGGSFPLVQLSIWTTSRQRSNTLRRLIRTSLEGATVADAAIKIDGIQDTTDEGNKDTLYGAILELRLNISS